MQRNRRRQSRTWSQVSGESRKAANRVEQLCQSLAEPHVQPGISRTGRVVLRCSTCGKVCYRDQLQAEEAVAKIPDPMVAYLSKRCGWWHLATDKHRQTR